MIMDGEAPVQPSGNRCGHDPEAPRWFEPPERHKPRPGHPRVPGGLPRGPGLSRPLPRPPSPSPSARSGPSTARPPAYATSPSMLAAAQIDATSGHGGGLTDRTTASGSRRSNRRGCGSSRPRALTRGPVPARRLR
jgi:hypothetical protein